MIHPGLIRSILLFILFSNQLEGQSDVLLFEDLSGDALLEEITKKFKPGQVLPYSQAKDVMYSEIYIEDDSVSCVYSGHTLYLPDNVDPSIHLYMDGSTDGINTEHTYPRSKGASEDNGNAFSDLHHLFPTRVAVNISRSNFPFEDITDQQTTSWFYANQSQSRMPMSNIDSYSERVNGRFEPREDHKGNVARAMFYFFTMYKEFALDADPEYFESQRETLCQWHNQDPVNQAELDRTFKIAEYQDDQPNPFVLDCSVVNRSYCEDFQFGCALLTPTDNIQLLKSKVFPNPVDDQLHIISEGNNQVRVLDILGRRLFEGRFSNSTDIDFKPFKSGTYLVQVENQVIIVVK